LLFVTFNASSALRLAGLQQIVERQKNKHVLFWLTHFSAHEFIRREGATDRPVDALNCAERHELLMD
jgi:hypothetical protein